MLSSSLDAMLKLYLRKECSHGNCITLYSVMQSDGNSLKIDTFREAITSELMISF